MATPSSSTRDAVVAMAAKYSESLPGYVDASTLPRYIAPASHSPPKYPVTVLLTGSTGHLGSEILASLLTDGRVERVYTLDRAGKENSLDRARKGASLDRAGRGVDGATAGVRDRQRARWADKGLDDELLQSPKLVPLEGDVSAPRFGQSEEVYREMLASVSVVIHTAWRVNFNLPLDALKHSIRGVRALVDFAREASRAGYTRQEELIGVAREAQLAGARQAEPVEDPQRDPHARSFRFLFTSSTTAARSWEDVAVVLSGDTDMASSLDDVNAGQFDASVNEAQSTADVHSASLASSARSLVIEPNGLAASDMPPSCHPIPSVTPPRAPSLTLPRSLSSTIPRAPSPTLPRVPEALIDDPASCIGGGGYGQSKYVAERILAAGGVEFASVRIGQVCGGRGRVGMDGGKSRMGAEICINETRRGAWATTNWFPILVKTSLALGALPADEQPMPWLPMDVTAHALLDIVFSSKPLEPSYNLVHPRPISFSKIIGLVQRSLALTTGVKVSFVPFKDWMARLEDAARRPGVSARDVPGIKLIPFLHDVCAGGAFGRDFAMEKIMRISSALRDVDSICQADVDAWVRYWEECGMFSGRGTDAVRARM
ncbi:male sterility protein-domain-containing protein [Schizophyllum commune]